MNERMHSGLLEATRLTRAGQLVEATGIGVAGSTSHCRCLRCKRAHWARPNALPWHGRGQGFDSPQVHQRDSVNALRGRFSSSGASVGMTDA